MNASMFCSFSKSVRIFWRSRNSERGIGGTERRWVCGERCFQAAVVRDDVLCDSDWWLNRNETK